MDKKNSRSGKSQSLHGERGAALITVLFISVLVLALAGALVLTTSISTTNAVSATDETQAYYAAEGGLQAALNVLRGNVPPTINFKNALANPQLSQWLVYDYPSGNPDRVTLSPGYSLANGTAYRVTEITDPDRSSQVIYSTSGSFILNGNTSSSLDFGGNVTLTYTPQSSIDVSLNGNPTLGSLSFTGVRANPPTDITIPANTSFTLQITETAPLPFGGTSPVIASIRGTLSGRIYPPNPSVTLTFNNSSIEIPDVGTLFVMSNQTLTIPIDGTTRTIQTTVTTPEPRRLVVKVQGYGPHGAIKNMQTMVSRFGVNYDPPATFVIRGAASNGASTISIGSSANYVYSGADNANGQPLPAFLVTNDPDYTTLSTLKTNNPTGVQGDPTGLIPILKKLTLPTELSGLPVWLRTTSDPVYGARAFVQQLRLAAQQQFSGCVSEQDTTCDRYFNTRAGDSPPSDFGAGTTQGLITFVDGDVSLPNSGGKGLLVVTGTVFMDGSQTFDGLVLVLGDGVLDRSGGGNGTSLGAFVVAKFGSTGDFLVPTFTSSGSGISTLQLDRNKVKSALRLGGVYAMAVSEL